MSTSNYEPSAAVETVDVPEPEAASAVRSIKASEFKAKCLGLMDEVAETGREIIITKNGRPVSRLVPYRDKPKTLFGIDKGRLEILGDITSPVDVEWKAVRSFTA